MNILGLHVNTGQSAAALLCDGAIRFAAAEERFDRNKQSRAFPKRAIRFCLEQAGLDSLEELDGIAISWNPAINMRHINLSGFTQWRRYDPEWLYIIPNQILSMGGADSFAGPVLEMRIRADGRCPLYFVDHHRAHLGHAIAQSPFEEGLALVVDEYGEYDSVTAAVFRGRELEIVGKTAYPNSLGVFYAAFTEYLGFTPNSDEWKVMGAAAYGDPNRFRSAVERILAWDEGRGEWVLDTRFVEHANMKRAGYLNERLIDVVGLPVRRAEEPLGQAHFDLAAAAQAVFEERLFALISHYARKTGQTNLAAAGGCFMNSLANGKLIGATPIRRLFIPYAAADNGGAMGAALYAWHYWLGKERRPMESAATPYLGPEYADEEIEKILKRFGLAYEKPDDITAFAAREIAAGRLLGWFQGRMEFGERALGNRSILADPRDGRMKDRINAAVKYREAFRPFAPSVLAERVSDYFEIPAGENIPYMEKVYPVRASRRAEVPAVVHQDGTGRLQTVQRRDNPKYYDLIAAVEKETGVPIVLNTSFNVQGEPIVCSPEDAIRTFFSCGLDRLVLGSYFITK